jgi:hypothetical protein
LKVVLATTLALCLAAIPAAFAGGPPVKVSISKKVTSCPVGVPGQCWAAITGSGLPTGASVQLWVDNAGAQSEYMGFDAVAGGKFSQAAVLQCSAKIDDAWAEVLNASNAIILISQHLAPPC